MPAPTPCPRCGALNDATFADCIRCGGALSADAPKRPPKKVSILLAKPARPIATIAFAVLTSAVFAAQILLALAHGEGLRLLPRNLSATDIRLGVLIPDPALVRDEPFRLLSAVFVHFGILHFLMNGWAFVDLGRIAETMLGRGRFAVTYVLAGIGGFGVSVAMTSLAHSPVAPTAGASGAVFGLMGVVLGTLVARRDPRWKSFAMRAVVYSLVFGFAINASDTGIAINNAAHIGGLLVGLAAGLLARRQAGAATPTRATDIAGGVAFVASIASIALAYRSPLATWIERG